MDQPQYIRIHYRAKHRCIGCIFCERANADARRSNDDIRWAKLAQKSLGGNLHGRQIPHVGAKTSGIESLRTGLQGAHPPTYQAQSRIHFAIMLNQRRAQA